MSRTFKATGINLKAMPMGEADRLVTILTPELGLMRVVAPGSRKHHSKLGGRSGLFVVNHLMLAQGKSLNKLIQAETIRSFPGLSAHLGKLTASQYLAELVLFQALSDQPQEGLYYLLLEHLERLERASPSMVLAALTQGIFHLLAIAGVAPEVRQCCMTQAMIQPDLSIPDWQVGFSIPAGGIVHLSALDHVQSLTIGKPCRRSNSPTASLQEKAKGGNARDEPTGIVRVAESEHVGYAHQARSPVMGDLNFRLSAPELALLQQLSQSELRVLDPLQVADTVESLLSPHVLWQRLERLLRQYAQYHFDRPIRAATLIDTCFPPPSTSLDPH